MIIKVYFFVVLFLLISGCSTKKFKRRNLEDKSFDLLKSGLSKVCLSGEGRGRFYTKSERQTFSFESLLDLSTKRLDVSYHFPFHGEEGLSIFYKEALKEQINYKGSLFDRIKKESQKGEEKDFRSFFSPYMKKLGEFLFLLNSFKEAKYFDTFVRCTELSRGNGLVEGECVYEPLSHSFSWETSINHFSFYFGFLSRKGGLKLTFDREKEKFFSKWTLSFYTYSQDERPLTIEKYMTSCAY